MNRDGVPGSSTGPNTAGPAKSSTVGGEADASKILFNDPNNNLEVESDHGGPMTRVDLSKGKIP